MADPKLLIQIEGEAKKYLDALNEAESSTKNLQEVVDKFGKVAAVSFAAFSAAIGFSIKNAAEAEIVNNRLAQAITATGGAAGLSSKELIALADNLQKVTTFDDETIKSAETLLLTFDRVGKEIFPQATEAALDLATGLGIDATSAVQLLGRALQDPIQGMRALRQAGIFLSESQKQVIENFIATGDVAKAQALILQEVENRFGGAARAGAQGAGVFIQLKNSFNDLAENIGKEFLPAAEAAARIIKDILDFAKENADLVTLAAKFLAVGAAVTGIVTSVSAIIAILPTLTALLAPLFGPVGIIVGLVALVAAFADWEAVIKKVGAVIGPLFSTISSGFTVIFSRGRLGIEEFKKSFEELEKALSRPIGVTISKEPLGPAGAEPPKTKSAEDNQKALVDQKKKELQIEIDGEQKKALEAERARIKEEQNQKAHHDILNLQSQGAGQESLAIQKDINELNKASLESQTEEEADLIQRNLNLKNEQLAESLGKDAEIRGEARQNLLDADPEFQALELEQETAFTDERQRAIDERLRREEDAIRNDRKAKENEDKASRAKFLEDQRKYGKAYAEIQKFARDNELGQATTHFQTLSNLQTSQNTTLKTIGKAAAITKIVQETATGAVQAFNAYAGIPFIGAALGAAAAAIVVAFGAENIGKVVSAQEGGLLTGGIPGRDSIPVLAAPGELVVPAKNFDEVINAVADDRNNRAVVEGATSPVGPPTGQTITVEIAFAGDAVRLLTAKQIENRSLGLSRDNL